MMIDQEKKATITIESLEELKSTLLGHTLDKDLTCLSIVIEQNRGWIVYGRIDGISVPPENNYEIKLGMLPEEIGRLSKLQILDLSFLGINKLPPGFSKLSRLRILRLAFNDLDLHAHKEMLTSLKNLEVLMIYGCQYDQDFVSFMADKNPKVQVRYTQEHYFEDVKTYSFCKNPQSHPDFFGLLYCIQQYYPIGMPYNNSEYPGYARLLKILEEKFNMIESQGKIEPWETMVEKVKQDLNSPFLFNGAFYQFPALHAGFEFKKFEKDNLQDITWLCTDLSLLAPYFTVYFKNELKRERQVSPSGKKRLAQHCIWYGQESLDDREREYLDLLTKSVRHSYPNHTYVAHDKLLGWKISGGLPHGEDAELIRKEYPVYCYLFGPLNEWESRTVWQ